MKPEGTRARRQRETRRGLVDAAIRLYADSPPEAVSLHTVSAEAGFTRGAFHANFGTRADLVRAVRDTIAADAHAAIWTGLTALPRAQRIPEFVRRHGRYARSQPVRARALVAAVTFLAHSESYGEQSTAARDELEILIRSARPPGHEAIDPRRAATFIRILLDSHIHALATAADSEALEDALVAFVGSAVLGIASVPGA